MLLSFNIRCVILTSAVLQLCTGFMEVKSETLVEFAEICKNVTAEPKFKSNYVASRTWKIFYSWNLKLDEECPELTFKHSNDMILNRVWKDMRGYLKAQPQWSKAALLMTVGAAGRYQEILLINDDSDIPGQFIGVPCLKPAQILEMYKGLPVPFMKIYMNMLHRGKYLISSDCRLGITILAVKRDKRPMREDIERVAAILDFGDGFPTCVNEPNPGEEI